MTQFLTGHDQFRAYTKLFAITTDNLCIYCGISDTMEHTIFRCARWTMARGHLRTKVDVDLTSENVISTMLNSKEGWKGNAIIKGMVYSRVLNEYQYVFNVDVNVIDIDHKHIKDLKIKNKDSRWNLYGEWTESTDTYSIFRVSEYSHQSEKTLVFLKMRICIFTPTMIQWAIK